MGNCFVIGRLKKKYSTNHHNNNNNNNNLEKLKESKNPDEKKSLLILSNNHQHPKCSILTGHKNGLKSDHKSKHDLNDRIFKILILGTGESGKSTLIKQMKIIHNDGYTRDEMLEFKPIILDNLVSSMKYVVTGMRLLRIDFQYETNQDLAKDLILSEKYFDDYHHILFPHLKYALTTLWQDQGVREAVARGFEYELNDSALYYFENMDRLMEEKYVPNTNDVVKSRIRTIGVVETEFKIRDHCIRMYDVGGQRSERRKWIQCFADVRTLLFVVAISEYDMTLIEDQTRNRLKESLLLFDNISNNFLFRSTTTILFLNKYDLFREKILFTERQLRYFFADYHGPDNDPEKASVYIENLFKTIAHIANPNKSLKIHYTTATDTANIEQVLRSIVNIILSDNLAQSTLL